MEVDERFFKSLSSPTFDKSQFVILRPHKLKDLVEGVDDKYSREQENKKHKLEEYNRKIATEFEKQKQELERENQMIEQQSQVQPEIVDDTPSDPVYTAYKKTSDI